MTAVGLALGGCAQTPALHALTTQQSALQQQAQQSAQSPSLVATRNQAYVAPTKVDYQAPQDTVSLQASGLPLAQALRQAIPAGWSLSFEGGTDPNQGVSVSLNGVSRNSAIRQTAMAGGDVAVIESTRRSVIIAKRATYTYRVPMGLLNGQSANLSVSSSSTLSGGSSGGSSSGGSSMGGAPGGSSGGSSGGGNGSSFSVTGGTASSGFVSTVKSLAGENGVVSIDPSTGLVSVTAGAGGLMRTQRYIDAYTKAANTKVEIHAAILQVQLNRGISTGIKWNRLFNAAGSLSASLSAAQPALGQVVSGASTTAFSITKTGTDLNGIIQALQKVTTVRVVTKPWLVATNGTPATINSGTQVPYVGSITNSVSGLSGTSSTGSSLSYANNGVALSFIPQVLGHGWVQMAVMPSLSTIERFDTFNVSGQTLTGPVLQQRQAFVRLLMKSGQTVIMGGSISNSAIQQTGGIPGLSRIPVLGGLFGNYGQGHDRTQLVILVRAKVIPAPAINPLVGETL
ncbi:hypothetical protein BW247_05120 [Acidihalobacter ferrooxydans]|uniref:Type II/III secretion system secretin-like domain-containing protein n=2 Tax=Acidihalobacter ferrooxydans TaxID=1765967 RepID=A0A1P8UFC7_9GAMM|nr:hypothetical protein BW247_05120 [Acidihalobacter ferrooxydans]